MKTSVLEKLLSSLSDLSPAELDDLMMIIGTGESRKAFLEALKEIRRLRLACERVISTAGIQRHQSSDDIAIESHDELHGRFIEILNDRRRFRSNSDVIDAIKFDLGLGSDISHAAREPRSVLIDFAWMSLLSLPKEERKDRLRMFLMKYTETHDDYQDMFKLLSRQ